MNIKNFVKARPYIFWYIKDFDSLSDDSIVENVLNYGTFDDIEKMIKIMTMENVSKIFYKKIKAKRSNIKPKIENYFKLYFEKYAK